MISSLEGFRKTWLHESASTIQLFEALTDESLSTRIDDEHRTLGRIANHLIETITEMPEKLGLPIKEESPNHTNVADLVRDYREKSDALLAAVDATLSDGMLTETRNMYGMEWTVAYGLHVIIMHQCHHRGQMTVLMRQAGLVPPGMYGPTKEAWLTMGMTPLD